jgi:putative ABC transport system ATP-binding protein
MEWQMSGGDVPAKDVKSPKPTEEEEVERELEEEKEEVAGRNRV